MKTSRALILSVISLSLALCACDSGDKKETGAAPPLPPKKPKTEGGEVQANPQPPEPTEPSKDMNAPAVPAGPADLPETTDQKQLLEMLNMAVGQYAQKQMTAGMGKSGRPGGGKTTLTSLDQLVKAGILKAIPEAPAGKKFVLDVTTQKVKLEPK